MSLCNYMVTSRSRHRGFTTLCTWCLSLILSGMSYLRLFSLNVL